MKPLSISAALLAALAAVGLLLLPNCSRHESNQSKASGPAPAASPTSGGTTRSNASGYAGVGWSIEADTDRAVAGALTKAGGTPEPGGLTMVFYTPHHDPRRVADAARRASPPTRRLLGVTTHVGVLTPEGYFDAATGVVGVLTTHLNGVTYGLGIASFDEATPAEAAKLAYRRAIAEAHASKDARPSMIVMFGTMTTEESLLAALAEETGPDVPLIGGTAAGLASMMERKTKEVALIHVSRRPRSRQGRRRHGVFLEAPLRLGV